MTTGADFPICPRLEQGVKVVLAAAAAPSNRQANGQNAFDDSRLETYQSMMQVTLHTYHPQVTSCSDISHCKAQPGSCRFLVMVGYSKQARRKLHDLRCR
ncbi:hypothetical protein VPH35_017446 [Triticum aestivum]|uniref:Uncharacterized protein n=1 Tax=Aegilops tauschii subsp. strangulata TaxID=200361 RepID=A0A453A2C6_AEGTS